MTDFSDRFGAFAPYGVSPEDYRAAMLKKAMGVTLNTPPVSPDLPRSVQTVPITPTDPAPTVAPIRLPDALAVQAWRTGADQDIKNGDTANPPVPFTQPAKPPAAFPTDTAAVPYTAPAVAQQGTTLTTAPVNPNAGWEASVGQGASPAAAATNAFNWDKTLGSLDDIAKGLSKNKAPTPNPFPAMPAEQPNQPSQMAYQLMAALMNKGRGLTLTGRPQ